MFDSDNIGATITDHVFVDENNEHALEKAVANIGPIAVSIDSSLSSFHHYKSGVFYDEGE